MEKIKPPCAVPSSVIAFIERLVRMYPGLTTVTQIFDPLTSERRQLKKASQACLLAASKRNQCNCLIAGDISHCIYQKISQCLLRIENKLIIHLQADLNGIAILPCTLLTVTIWPVLRSSRDGNNAATKTKIIVTTHQNLLNQWKTVHKMDAVVKIYNKMQEILDSVWLNQRYELEIWGYLLSLHSFN